MHPERIWRVFPSAQPFQSHGALGLRLNQDAVADQVESLVLGGGFPAGLRRAGLQGDDFPQHVLPGAGGHQRVAVTEVDDHDA